MLIDKIKWSFVNLNTGIETHVFDLDLSEPMDSESDEIAEVLDDFKMWVQKGENLYLRDNKVQIVFGNLKITDNGFFKFDLVPKKFLTDEDD